MGEYAIPLLTAWCVRIIWDSSGSCRIEKYPFSRSKLHLNSTPLCFVNPFSFPSKSPSTLPFDWMRKRESLIS